MSKIPFATKVRILKPDTSGRDGFKKGDVVTIIDGTLSFIDRRGDRRMVSLTECEPLSAEEAERDATVERLRDRFLPATAPFKTGDVVTIDDDTDPPMDGKTGLVLGGPDADGDYQVGVEMNNGAFEHWWYSATDLRAA